MTQPPPPPGYGYPPPPGYGYPPPPGYGYPPPPPPRPAAPPPPPKSRQARLLDALTIVFEIVIFLLVLAYVLARMSANEGRAWTNRVEAAQALRRAALQSERTQLAAAGQIASRGGAVLQTSLTLDAGAWLTTLESILDEQAAIEKAGDDTRKQLRADALKSLGAGGAAKTADYAAVIQALSQALTADAPPPDKTVAALLKDSAAPLQRLVGLQSAGAVALDRLPELAPGAPEFKSRRAALRSLMVLLAAESRQAAQGESAGAELRRKAHSDRQMLVTLATVYLHAYLPADGEILRDDCAAGMAQTLNLCVRTLNQASVAATKGAPPRGDADAAGRLAGSLEQALPSAADLIDRLIARLIADHLASWHQGAKTALWNEEGAPKTGDWTGTDPYGTTANALLTLSANLHAIDGRPVTATVTIRNVDGSSEPMLVSAWLARLANAAAGSGDGDLHVGSCDLSALAAKLDGALRLARGQLHLLQVNARLLDQYWSRAGIPGEGPQIPTTLGDDLPIDPLTGKPYLYKPYADDWNLFSDYGEDDPAATPNQSDDPKKDMKATLRQGLVLR